MRQGRRFMLFVSTAMACVAVVAVVTATASAGPPPPWHPGDLVWTSPPPVTELQALSSGCQRVPATGYISPGVYAETSSQYSTFWDWSAASAADPFHWYIFTSGGTLKAHGASGGGGGSRSVSANVHYWKVQNQGSVPQAWSVCWND